jgi:hypothetical protein
MAGFLGRSKSLRVRGAKSDVNLRRADPTELPKVPGAQTFQTYARLPTTTVPGSRFPRLAADDSDIAIRERHMSRSYSDPTERPKTSGGDTAHDRSSRMSMNPLSLNPARDSSHLDHPSASFSRLASISQLSTRSEEVIIGIAIGSPRGYMPHDIDGPFPAVPAKQQHTVSVPLSTPRLIPLEERSPVKEEEMARPHLDRSRTDLETSWQPTSHPTLDFDEPSPRQKGGRWKLFGGLFRTKSVGHQQNTSKASPPIAQSHGQLSPLSVSKAERILGSPLPSQVNSPVTPKMTMHHGAPRYVDAGAQISRQPSKRDAQTERKQRAADLKAREKLEKERTATRDKANKESAAKASKESKKLTRTRSKRKIPDLQLEGGPMLDVDIPSVQMERYSVMFGSLLHPQRSDSLLARRQIPLEMKVATEADIVAQVSIVLDLQYKEQKS